MNEKEMFEAICADAKENAGIGAAMFELAYAGLSRGSWKLYDNFGLTISFDDCVSPEDTKAQCSPAHSG